MTLKEANLISKLIKIVDKTAANTVEALELSPRDGIARFNAVRERLRQCSAEANDLFDELQQMPVDD